MELMNELNKLVEEGYVRKAENEDLAIYKYTDKCTYEKHWNEYTRQARGLILEKKTGKIVAQTFNKFFNLNEMPETTLTNLPQEPYQVFDKVDGSLGIIYFYNNKWNVATCGSLNSDQAQRATSWLDTKYPTTEILEPGITYLAEIIYPENKIVVDYKDFEGFIFLAAFELKTRGEMSYAYVEDVAQRLGAKVAIEYNYTIAEMTRLQKTIPKDQEGFIVRFKSGLRVKIKGEEYMKIARMLANLSPLAFWEGMEDGKVKSEYLMQLPEEFRAEYEPIVAELENQYRQVQNEIGAEFEKLIPMKQANEPMKNIALFVKDEKNGIKHKSAMFTLLSGKSVDTYTMKLIRPKANVLLNMRQDS
jgi:RNA ligase